MPDGQERPEWLYYRLYVGHAAGGIDYLITNAVPKILARGQIEKWFFLRYFDEGGLHLRLRLKPRGEKSQLREIAGPVIDEALCGLPLVPPPLYRPVIAKPAMNLSFTRGVIRSVESVYEPEADKFGAAGIAVAEEVFQLSSEAATTALIDEYQGGCSRKTLAPLLMSAVREAFVEAGGRTFWADYSSYWLRTIGESAEHWSPRFARKARELRDAGVAILTPDCRLSSKARAALSLWRAGLARAVTEFDAVAERPGRIALAFHFTHLMNNRLGILPLEESYFSALLHEDAAE